MNHSNEVPTDDQQPRMRVVLVNHSDLLGGAAMASHRLMEALQHQGIDARMLVVDRRDHLNPAVATVGGSLRNRWNFVSERASIYLRNGMRRTTLFRMDTGEKGVDISRHPWVRKADVIVLNWINQGMLSLRGVERLCSLGKPVVWVMHDMWNCTGICHHAFECRAYLDKCTACPMLKTSGDDLSTAVQQHKAELYSAYPDIHFVAVSNWLADCCRHSSLLRNSDISVIGNPFPVNDYQWARHATSMLDIDPKMRIIAMGAARLDDKVKGFNLLIEATRLLAHDHPELAQNTHLLLYGTLRDTTLLDRVAIPCTHLGYVQQPADIYHRADVVLSTSRYESFGYTLVEGMACGCLAVATNSGGQADIVSHKQNGYLANSNDPADIAEGIVWALNSGISREVPHQWVRERFNSTIIAEQYIKLFDRLLAK